MSLARNTVYNIAGSLVPIALSLASVPLYLRHIGLERYGVLSISWLLLGYLGLFDFGLGRAVSQRLAAMRDDGEDARSAVFWTGFFTSLALGVVAAAAGFGLFLIALSQMKFSSAAMAAEVHHSVPLLSLAMPLTLVGGLFTGALLGRERFATINLLSSLGNVLSVVLPIGVALLVGPDLRGLIAAVIAGSVIASLFAFAAAWRAVPLLPPRLAPAGTLASLLRFGGWVSVSNAVAPILAFFDRFVIGSMISTSAVSVYSVPFNLVMRLTIIPNAVSSALFPRYAAAPDAEAAARMSRDAVAAISLLVTPAAFVMLGAVRPFLEVWVGHAVAASAAGVAYLLVPGYWINCYALIAYNALHAQARPDLSARIHLVQVVPFVAILLVAVHFLGLKGAALAWSLRTTIDAGMLFRVSPGGVGALRPVFGTAVLVWLCGVTGLVLSPLSIAFVAIVVGCGTVATLLAFRAAPTQAKSWLFGRMRGAMSGVLAIRQPG